MSNIFPLSEYGIQQSIILLSRTIRNWIDDNVAYIKQLDKNYQTLNKVTKPGLYYLRGTESGSPSQLLGEGLLVVINHGRYPIELASEELYCKDLQLVIDYSTLDFMFRVKDGQDKEFAADWNYKLMGQRGGEGDQSTVTGVGSRALTYASYGGGINSIAGCYCFTISRDEAESFDHVYEGNAYGVYKLDSIVGIEAGDIISLQLNYVKDFYATVLAVAGDSNDQTYGITLKPNQILIDKEIYKNDKYIPEEHGEPTLWIPYKPTVGTMPLGQSQAVFGTDCIASGEESFATGIRSKALSKYAFVWGRDGVAAYASMAGGRECQATGESSFAVGHQTIASGVRAFAANTNTKATGAYSTAFGQGAEAEGQASFAGGYGTRAVGAASTALGHGTIATRVRSTAVGSYNEERDDAYFIVGKGTGNTNRSNAFVVLEDGSAEVTTVGNNSKSVVTRSVFDPVALKVSISEADTRANMIYGEEYTDISLPMIEQFDSKYSGIMNVKSSSDATLYKYGVNLIKIDPAYDQVVPGTNIVYSKDENGITMKSSDGVGPAKTTNVRLSNFKIPYLPKGTYRIFLNNNIKPSTVIIQMNSDEKAGIVAAYLSGRQPMEVTVDYDMHNVYFNLQISNRFATTDEIIFAPICTPVATKTTFFVPFEEPESIIVKANEETLVPVNDSNGIFIFSDVEDTSISYKRQISIKDYIDQKIEEVINALLEGQW